MAAGTYHTLFLLEDGEVYSWEEPIGERIGHGGTQEKIGAQIIKNIPGKVIGLAAGVYHSLVVNESGEVYSWGANVTDHPRDRNHKDRITPKLIEDIPDKVTTVAAGDYHSLALTQGGIVYGWSRNIERQLGYYPTEEKRRSIAITGITGKVVKISAGSIHSLAVTESGEVYGWGNNEYGQLGDGTTETKVLPQLKVDIPGKVIGVAAGIFHTLALLESGEVYGWGNNEYGQIGNGTHQEVNGPQLIFTLPEKVVAIAAGSFHSLALLERGEVYGWGWNGNGQLGGGKIKSVLFPRKISKLNKRILYSPFGKGGRAISFTELEKIFRKLLSQEISL